MHLHRFQAGHLSVVSSHLGRSRIQNIDCCCCCLHTGIAMTSPICGQRWHQHLWETDSDQSVVTARVTLRTWPNCPGSPPSCPLPCASSPLLQYPTPYFLPLSCRFPTPSLPPPTTLPPVFLPLLPPPSSPCRRYAGKQKRLGSIPLQFSLLFKKVQCGLWTLVTSSHSITVLSLIAARLNAGIILVVTM